MPALDTDPSTDAGAVWRRILTVAWCAVVLGVAVEVAQVAVAAGWGKLQGVSPIVAETLQKISWSFLVCAGLACGTVALKAKPFAMGIAGVVFGPVAFIVSRMVHKAANQALSLTATAGSGPPPTWIAALKGLEYGFLGALLGWVAVRNAANLKAYLAAGALTGIVFGGFILGWMIRDTEPALTAPAIVIRSINEILFPVGCAFVLYVAHAIERRTSAT